MISRYKTFGELTVDDEAVSQIKTACSIPDIDPDGETTFQLLWKKYFYHKLGWEDQNMFLYYFTNNIETYKDQYAQLLRNKPGAGVVVNWMVQIYRERELKHRGVESTKRTQGADELIKNSTLNGTEDINYGKGVLKSKNGSENHAQSGVDTDIHSGGYTDTYTEGEHTQEYSPHVGKKTQNGGHRSNWNGHKEIQAQLPMEKQYDDFITAESLESGSKPEDQSGYFASLAGKDMPSKFDNSTATAQGQTFDRAYDVNKLSVTESYEYGKDNQGDITKRQGSATNPDITRRDYDADKQAKTYGKTEDIRYDNIVDDEQNSGADHITKSETTGGSDTHTHGDIKDEGNKQEQDRERFKGRDLDPATLLTRANAFIKNSNAWDWFTRQLDPCFLTNIE